MDSLSPGLCKAQPGLSRRWVGAAGPGATTVYHHLMLFAPGLPGFGEIYSYQSHCSWSFYQFVEKWEEKKEVKEKEWREELAATTALSRSVNREKISLCKSLNRF